MIRQVSKVAFCSLGWATFVVPFVLCIYCTCVLCLMHLQDERLTTPPDTSKQNLAESKRKHQVQYSMSSEAACLVAFVFFVSVFFFGVFLPEVFAALRGNWTLRLSGGGALADLTGCEAASGSRHKRSKEITHLFWILLFSFKFPYFGTLSLACSQIKSLPSLKFGLFTFFYQSRPSCPKALKITKARDRKGRFMKDSEGHKTNLEAERIGSTASKARRKFE